MVLTKGSLETKSDKLSNRFDFFSPDPNFSRILLNIYHFGIKQKATKKIKKRNSHLALGGRARLPPTLFYGRTKLTIFKYNFTRIKTMSRFREV